MRIWTLGEIINTEHEGHERYVLDSEVRKQEQKWALESLEQSKETEQLRKENEWLFEEMVNVYNKARNPKPPPGEAENCVNKHLKQALKEGK